MNITKRDIIGMIYYSIFLVSCAFVYKWLVPINELCAVYYLVGWSFCFVSMGVFFWLNVLTVKLLKV